MHSILRFWTGLSLFALFTPVLMAQNPAVSIATWKNGAAGVYSAIHDDFGDSGVDGIQNYADTLYANRGLKFTFGAITSTFSWRKVTWNGVGNQWIYDVAKQMVNTHGHELINHSHTHSCAVTNANCGGTGTNYRWGEAGPTEAFDLEIDQSNTLLNNHCGVYPRFFIYPYDQFNANANNYLKSVGYIGARTGAYEELESNTFTPDADGFFQPAFVVDIASNTSASGLNAYIDQAINDNKWVCHEFHNVGNSGWGYVPFSVYQSHLNYVKQKVTANQLWVATISEVLTYQIQKLNYTPTSSYNSGNGTITVNWNTPTFNVANYLSPLRFKSPVTLVVDLNAYPGVYTVYQNGNIITDWTTRSNIAYINVYPHEGPVELSLTGCPAVCISSQPTGATIDGGDNYTFSVSAVGTGTFTYQWYKNGNLISGAESSTYEITNAVAGDAANYTVTVSNGTNTVTSQSATLVVQVQTAFGGNLHVIPGTIEAEDFDEGGEGISFHETSAGNAGDGDAYRTTDVDIEICNEGGYSVGYVAAGEWLEYSVNVLSAGNYDFTFRIASQNTGQAQGAFTVNLDGSTVIANTSVPFTGGWATWQNLTVNNVALPQGNHILRLTAVSGDFNINYLMTSGATTGVFSPGLEALYLYPNPAQQTLHVQNPDHSESLEVLDLSGHLITRFSLESGLNTLDISSLPKGVYMVKSGLRMQKLIVQ